MNLIALIEISKDEMSRHKLKGWRLILSTAPQNAGECDLQKKLIRINSYRAYKRPKKEILDVLAEEIEHAIVCGKCPKRFKCDENFHCRKLTNYVTKG